jgi:hypothetical protein
MPYVEYELFDVDLDENTPPIFTKRLTLAEMSSTIS